MSFTLLDAALVEAIHDAVLDPGELPGRAGDTSLDGAFEAIETCWTYGLIGDVFDLAAACGVAIAQGHCFNDGNKRTAFRAIQIVLDLHGHAEPDEPVEQVGQRIIAVAQGLAAEEELAAWLRAAAAG